MRRSRRSQVNLLPHCGKWAREREARSAVWWRTPARSRGLRRERLDEKQDGLGQGSALPTAPRPNGRRRFAWLAGNVLESRAMNLRIDDLTGPEIAAFLHEHLEDMRAVSPPESKHALDLPALRRPEITFWTAWSDRTLIGCCALKMLDAYHGEVKSMRVAAAHRGKGIGASLVAHVVAEAQRRRYTRLSLETGAMPFFEPARRLYRRCGFELCGPFADYKPDPNSVFMTRQLECGVGR